MRVGQVVDVRGVAYIVTRILPDGEPCLTRVDVLTAGGIASFVRVAGGGFLGQ